MRRSFRWAVVAVLVVLVVAYGLISYLIAVGVTKAERKEQEDQPSAYGLEYEDVEFASRGGGLTLEGWYVHSEARRPTVIFVHGIGSVRSGDGAVELASLLDERGFDVLMFDLRGHGSSGGDQVSAGQKERWDVLGAFDYLRSLADSPEEIGLLGFSMGAGIAVMAAAEEPAIRAVVADSPFAKASDLVAQETARKTVFPRWLVPIFLPTAKLMASQLYDVHLGKLVPEEDVSRLSYPVLVIHGEGDTRIPFAHGQRVYEAAPAGSTFWLVPEVDHVDAFITHPEEYVDRVAEYFGERLGVARR